MSEHLRLINQLNSYLDGGVQDEYKRLHQVAQVAAILIVSNLQTIEAASTGSDITFDDIIGLIIDQVIEAISLIVSEV